MYLEFYGLHHPPFRITPDTRVFFEGENRGATLEGLCYAITQGEGIVKVVGEVGSGKTMLCRMLPLKLVQGIDWVYLAHPSLSPEHTLHAITYELGLSLDEGTEKLSVMRALHNELLERHRQNRRVVVLVEEAQGMPLETLEEIRLLSNLETDESKLLQIVLFGQPELDNKLSAWEIRQLNERITHSLYLPPLDVEDIHNYLNFRLRFAGYKGPDIFTKKIAKKINKYSLGLTRRINIIADKSLMLAYSQGRHHLKVRDIQDAALDSQFGKIAVGPFKKLPRLLASLGFSALACFVLLSSHITWLPSTL
ncbi:MAG: ExeA family protein [Cellvibrionaceae bacterium]